MTSVRPSPAEDSSRTRPAPAHAVPPQVRRDRPLPPRPLGNQATLRRMALSRLQPKLAVGPVDDPLEQEADAVADRVMRMQDPAIAPNASPPRVSRACSACEDEEPKQRVLAKREGTWDNDGEREAPALVHDTLRAPGQPLDAQTLAFFEPRFGQDFSAVRVHRDGQAERSAQEVGALAYAVENHLVFGRDAYAPGTPAGKRLIAHELTHVVQQGYGQQGHGQQGHGQQGHGHKATVQRDTPAAPAPAQAPAPAPVPAPDGGAPAPAPAPTGVPCPPTATIVAKTLAEFVELMKCAESKLGLSPREMLTVFRQLYYGSQSWSVSNNPVWDDVVKCPATVPDPRPKLGAPLVDSLQASQEVGGVDVGHVFVGLEAMMCPTTNVTASKTVLGVHPSVGTPNEDFATWAGDLGAAVSAYSACPGRADAATNDDCFRLGGSPTLTDYLKASAPDQDLQGDIDAYALRAKALGIPCGTSALKAATLPAGPLSGTFQSYYNNPASPLGAAHTNNVQCFLESQGAVVDTTLKMVTNYTTFAPIWQDKVVEFALAFYYKTTLSKTAAAAAAAANAMHAGPMYTNSRAAVAWFVAWLSARL